MGTDGGVDPIGRTVLQRTGSDDRPEAFAEIPPSLAPNSLSHMSIHHHETLGVFGGVIGGLDFRVGDEMKVILPVEGKAMGEVINEPVNLAVGIAARLRDRVQCGTQTLASAVARASAKAFELSSARRWRASKSSLSLASKA